MTKGKFMKEDKEEIIDKEKLRASVKIAVKFVSEVLANLRKEHERFLKERAKIRKELKKELKNGCRKTSGLSI